MSKKFHERLTRGSGVQAKSFHSKFAASILKKYGWEEGTGRGKERSGTLSCVQIERREEKLGLGASKSPEVSGDQWHNWWDGLYNQAAKQADCSVSKGKKRVAEVSSSDSSSSDSDEVEAVTNKRVSGRARKQLGKLRRLQHQDSSASTKASTGG
eukprot:GHVS01074548.1.p1 GENE.GHVS01074548.1~~GHVS01074548.1.p1  ORF type:complete len:155 (+),score=23.47 GHVS01074548.1:53-517(+)